MSSEPGEANERMRVATTAAPLPREIDPEPDASGLARLAPDISSPTPGAQQANETLATRRFTWPLLQPRLHGLIIVVWLAVLVYIAWHVLAEFIGSWALTWVLVGYTLLVILAAMVLWGWIGEYIPGLGSSWVELNHLGVSLRLCYGRKPVGLAEGFSPGLRAWPLRTRILWRDVVRVGLYRDAYRRRGAEQVWYWVKLWTTNATGYVVLISRDQNEAQTLVRLLTENARLSRWATFDAQGPHLDSPEMGALDTDTLTLWKADRRRISRTRSSEQISLQLWRSPAVAHFVIGNWFNWGLALKIAALGVLLLLSLNYQYLLSYVLWTPPGPISDDPTWLGAHHDASNTNVSAQTLIPPLHEVWHTSLASNQVDLQLGLSLANGKLLALNFRTLSLYAARSGQLLHQYDLAALNDQSETGLGNTFGTISSDGNNIYLVRNEMVTAANQSSTMLYNLDAQTGAAIWRHPLNNGTTFAYQPERNLLIAPHSASNITGGGWSVEAINAQSGATEWQSETFTPTGAANIVIGGDTAYALLGDNPGLLVALDLNSGATRWKDDAGLDYALQYFDALADDRGVYTVDIGGITTYSRASGQLNYIKTDPYYFDIAQLANSSQVSLVSGKFIAWVRQPLGDKPTAGLISIDNGGTHPLATRSLGNGYSSQFYNLVVSNGLAFVEDYESDSGLPFIAPAHLLAYDLQTGRQVWRSPAYDYTSIRIIIGDGMLFTVNGGEVHAFAGAR